MRTPASIARHPIHPMLVPIPIGLLTISGWLGGKMVYEHGIAVDTPPDSLRR